MPTEELYLQDIVKSIDDIGRFLNGTDENAFLADEILQNAVLMKLVVIGEAAARISNETRTRYSEIEWKSIIGFRNISVKWSIVWETAANDLKTLRETVIKILATEFPDFELR